MATKKRARDEASFPGAASSGIAGSKAKVSIMSWNKEPKEDRKQDRKQDREHERNKESKNARTQDRDHDRQKEQNNDRKQDQKQDQKQDRRQGRAQTPYGASRANDVSEFEEPSRSECRQRTPRTRSKEEQREQQVSDRTRQEEVELDAFSKKLRWMVHKDSIFDRSLKETRREYSRAKKAWDERSKEPISAREEMSNAFQFLESSAKLARDAAKKGSCDSANLQEKVTLITDRAAAAAVAAAAVTTGATQVASTTPPSSDRRVADNSNFFDILNRRERRLHVDEQRQLPTWSIRTLLMRALRYLESKARIAREMASSHSTNADDLSKAVEDAESAVEMVKETYAAFVGASSPDREDVVFDVSEVPRTASPTGATRARSPKASTSAAARESEAAVKQKLLPVFEVIKKYALIERQNNKRKGDDEEQEVPPQRRTMLL
jgi:hypothetical protein